jgi:thiamine transporter ThiT
MGVKVVSDELAAVAVVSVFELLLGQLCAVALGIVVVVVLALRSGSSVGLLCLLMCS